MAHPQLHPLQFDLSRGEPFLRLPNPNDNIIITPPRMNDAPYAVQYLNDLSIVKWLEGPPYPYTEDDADSWMRMIKGTSDGVLKELREAAEADPGGPLITVGGCPVRAIREVKEDGSQVFIGDVGGHRCLFAGVEDPVEKARVDQENSQRDVGDPEIIWCIGDYLAPSHQGRGIMSAAVGTLMHGWMIPRMGVRQIRSEAYTGNIGSVRVFEKNGFVVEETFDYIKPKVLNSGQVQTGTHIMWWRS